MRENLLAAIAGLSDVQLSEPTLDGWSVKDHLVHIAHWDEIRAGEVARISAGFAPAWKHIDSADTDASNAFIRVQRTSFSVAQARWELETSRRRLVDALTTATPRGLDPSLYAEAGLRSTHEAEHTGWIRRWRRDKGY
jgi:uncharacterized damage-inducible protein DinB